MAFRERADMLHAARRARSCDARSRSTTRYWTRTRAALPLQADPLAEDIDGLTPAVRAALGARWPLAERLAAAAGAPLASKESASLR